MTLVGLILLLGIGHVASVYVVYYSDSFFLNLLAPKFNLDGEGNFPAFFSAAILLLSAFLFAVIGSNKKSESDPFWRHWLGLAFVFLFLSLDEAVQIHEMFDNNTLLSHLETSGLLAWPWVIPYIGLTLIFLVVYLRFFFAFSTRYRILFAASAAGYVLSAIGLEMVGAYVFEANQVEGALYVMVYTIEEALEMLSITLLIYSLLSYIRTEYAVVDVRVT